MQKYKITGMSCAACSARVEKAVGSVEGVDKCSVNLLTNSMLVEGSATKESIIKAVKKAGYGAKPIADGKKDLADLENLEMPRLLRRLVLSVFFLLILMYFSMGNRMLDLPLPSFMSDDPTYIAVTEMLLSLLIAVINRKFFINGAKGVFHLSPNMDTLVSLGSGVSFLWSTVILVLIAIEQQNGNIDTARSYMDTLYFESAAMILTLITVGKTLEAYSKGKTTDAVKFLMNLSPKMATVVKNGENITINTEELCIGDIFLLRPGEAVPTDGEIISGFTTIDESALTGESLPVDKKVGDEVYAATINNSGLIYCRATKVGENTTLAQIIKTVNDAAATKAPIAKIADRVSGIFVPTVLCISLVTLFVWLLIGKELSYSLARAISVLVISCPCALGLATPVAIMVGNGVGAKHGILFKTAEAIENTGNIKTVILDKTGTITEGRPNVTDIITADGTDRNELMYYAASAESGNRHPIALAIVNESQKEEIDFVMPKSSTVLPGNGVKADIDGNEIVGGSYAYLSEKYDVDESIRAFSDAASQQGKTPVLFSKNGIVIGAFAVSDTVKKNSPRAIRELKNMGIRVVMLTGDNKKTAEYIGFQVGVDEVISDVMPNEKENVIKKLSEYGRVAMVGDGINDAPALTRADIGIAIGAGADIAIDSADIVLMRSDLSDVPRAVRLSRNTLRTIKENLFWAFFYNAIGIPLAAGCFVSLGLTLNPMFGAAAMSISSFCVVMNALRINLQKI